MAQELRIAAVGEAAIFCQAAAAGSLATQQRIWSLDRAVRANLRQVECIVGMGNLTVAFDPLDADAGTLSRRILELWADCGEESPTGPTVEIPVVYGGSYGPDLAVVAQRSGLAAHEVARRHAAPVYTVFFMGFLPGFAYLGELDPSLATPRRDEPRLAVPAGSVGIGGSQTGIYPVDCPGGWQLIGRTRRTLFDSGRAQPALLSAGWRVRFAIEDILPC